MVHRPPYYIGAVTIGADCTIEDNTIIGYAALTNARHEIAEGVTIGDRVRIRPGCQIYRGCRIGNDSTLNHGVGLREETIIGSHTSIGTYCWCEGYASIGNYTTIHAQCHLTARLTIEDYVFMGPSVTTANARRVTYRRRAILPETIEQGATIKFGAIIGSQVMIVPGVVIGREAMIAAASLVAKDVPPFAIMVGAPARQFGKVPEKDRLRAGEDFPKDHPILLEPINTE